MMAGNPSSRRFMGSSPKVQQELQEPSSTLFSSSAHPQLLLGAQIGSSSSSHSSNYPFSDNYQDLPHSWSQLLMGGLTGEEDKFGGVVGHFQPFKKLENWEDQILNPIRTCNHDHDQASKNRSDNQDLIHHQSHMPVISSPRSCVTTSFSSNNYNNSNNIDNSKNNTILDFSNNKAADHGSGFRTQDHSSECNSTATGGVSKKARVHSSSSQPHLKVRKEKLGDRVTALHQLVSPFGKTDTASVLLEAIGYIRFLQGQIEALSTPYLGSSSGNMRTQQPVNQGERNGSFGPEAELQMDSKEKVKDLRSRGLCLVPVSYSQHVGSDNGADYWAPAFGSGPGF